MFVVVGFILIIWFWLFGLRWTVKDITDWLTSLDCVLELQNYHKDGVSVTIKVCFIDSLW